MSDPNREAGPSSGQPCLDPGPTALHEAAENGDLDEVVRILGDHPEWLEAPYCQIFPATPLHSAAAQDQVEIINLLIQRGATVDARDDEGKTPLHYAAKNGQERAIAALAASGAELQARDAAGLTPLVLAAFSQEERRRGPAQLLLDLGAPLDLFSALALRRPGDALRFLHDGCDANAGLADSSMLIETAVYSLFLDASTPSDPMGNDSACGDAAVYAQIIEALIAGGVPFMEGRGSLASAIEAGVDPIAIEPLIKAFLHSEDGRKIDHSWLVELAEGSPRERSILALLAKYGIHPPRHPNAIL